MRRPPQLALRHHSGQRREKANGKIQIKDLILGAGLTETKDREEYLKKQTEAQYLVDEADIIDEVRKVLTRHDVKWG